MTPRTLARLPIFACAGLILFLFLANIWNFAVERDWPKLRIRSAQPLNGVAPPQPAPWTLDDFLSGETQHVVSSNLGRASPLFQASVRLKNQFLYSLFKASGSANIVVGRDEQLLATGYNADFCQRGGLPDEQRIEAWSNMVKEIAEHAAARGQGFVYLVAPTKPAYEPRWLPPDVACAALEHGRNTDKLAPFDAALEARGVAYVDGQRVLQEQRGNYPIDLFPRGGIHWNLLGAALTIREISALFATQPRGTPLGGYVFDWREVRPAVGTDRDLLDLLNLYWPPDDYPTAAVFRRGEPTCDMPKRVLTIGDSFLRQIVIVASQAQCPPIIDYWFYAKADDGTLGLRRYLTRPGETGNGERLSADLALLPEAIAKAEALVLEENASNIANSQQVGNLLDAVRAAK
jgi:alginate O-acetyltransferase complex protein AlgJ